MSQCDKKAVPGCILDLPVNPNFDLYIERSHPGVFGEAISHGPTGNSAVEPASGTG